MTKDEQIKILKNCFNETIWMAIRYAHGRHTYAPSMVRDAIKDFQKVFPHWSPKHDITIEKPEDIFYGFRSDYLDDLFDNNENTNK